LVVCAAGGMELVWGLPNKGRWLGLGFVLVKGWVVGMGHSF